MKYTTMSYPHQHAMIQVFEGPGRPLKMVERPLPDDLGIGEIIAKIQLATICGSDLHTIAGHRQEPTPCVLGHEAVGEVVALGNGRPELSIGDRITWTIADSCGHCRPCLEYNLPQKCARLFKYGHASLDDGTGLNGCYASHMVVRGNTHVVKVPDSLPNRVIAPANCALATAVSAVSKLPETLSTVVVQGAGLLGLYTCALLREQGERKVFCSDIQPHRLEKVWQFGGIPIDGRPALYPKNREQIMDAAPDGVDAVLEMAGVAELVPEGVQLLRPGGHYGFVGMVHPNSQLNLTGEQIIRKCLTIFGIHNYNPSHLDQAVRFLDNTQHCYPYASLVSDPFPLMDLTEAIGVAGDRHWFRVAVRDE